MPRRNYSTEFKEKIASEALSLPPTARIKPICKLSCQQGYPISPPQLRKWIKMYCAKRLLELEFSV